MKNFIFLILFFPFILLAQTSADFNNSYAPLYSNGPLPKELTDEITQKTQNVLKALTKEKNPEYHIQYDFYTQTLFDEDDLLKDGNLVFNTRINKYIDHIADVLLTNNKELRSKLTFFVTRENEGNAWAYDNGHIYISMDYMAHFNTEAQIAMTLCHEIAHYTNQHHYKRYVKRAEVMKKISGRFNLDSIQLTLRNFFKIQESQADMDGYEMLKKSGYSSKDILEKYDLMLMCEYSFENIPFDINFFNLKYFKINPGVFYKEVKPISIDPNYDDTWDTHPNIYKRKKAIEESMKKSPPPTGKDFIVGETEFYYLRDMCRFETVKTDMRDFHLTTATYHAYCLLKKYPNNEYAKQCIASSLYKKAVFKSRSLIHQGFYDYLMVKDKVKTNANPDSTLGNISQVKKMFARLNGEDFVLLAINYHYAQYKQLGFKSDFYKTRLDTLFNILHTVHNLKYKDFFKNEKEYNQRTIYTSDTLTHNRNFVDAIDQKTAFMDYMPDKEFRAFFKDTVSTNEFGIKYIAKGQTGGTYKSGLAPKHVYYNKNEIKNVNKIILLNPSFDKTMYSKHDIEEYPFEAHEDAYVFKDNMIKKLNREKMMVLSFEDYRFDTAWVDKYNDKAIMHELVTACLQNCEVPSLMYPGPVEGKKIRETYGTPYVMQAKASIEIYDNGLVIYGQGMPFPIVKDYCTYYYHVSIVNVESGYTVYDREFESNGKLKEGEIIDRVQQDVYNIVDLKNQ